MPFIRTVIPLRLPPVKAAIKYEKVMMSQKTRVTIFAFWATLFCAGMCLLSGTNVVYGEIPTAPQMPAHWKVVSDFIVPAEQVKAMSSRLGADLSSVRNTIFLPQLVLNSF